VSDVPPVVLRPPAAGRRPFEVERMPPPAALADVVDHFWAVEWALPPGGRHRQDVVSHATSHVTVEDGRVWVQGVVTRRFQRELTGRGRVVGAHLRPAGIGALTHVPPAMLTDRRLPGERVLDDAAGLAAAVSAAPDAQTGMAAFAGWLTARDPRPPAGGHLVDEAVDLAAARPDLTRVDQLAAELGVTVRTLQRRFDRHLGAGPKWVLQRCRIQDALATIEAGGSVDWADLALRLGYADQSHFVNSFTALVGVPPGEYTRRPPVG
jgi:AraC-like DNA-binding protein